jgi:hypothetical protein
MEGWKDGRLEDWKVGRLEGCKHGRPYLTSAGVHWCSLSFIATSAVSERRALPDLRCRSLVFTSVRCRSLSEAAD